MIRATLLLALTMAPTPVVAQSGAVSDCCDHLWVFGLGRFAGGYTRNVSNSLEMWTQDAANVGQGQSPGIFFKIGDTWALDYITTTTDIASAPFYAESATTCPSGVDGYQNTINVWLSSYQPQTSTNWQINPAMNADTRGSYGCLDTATAAGCGGVVSCTNPGFSMSISCTTATGPYDHDPVTGGLLPSLSTTTSAWKDVFRPPGCAGCPTIGHADPGHWYNQHADPAACCQDSMTLTDRGTVTDWVPMGTGLRWAGPLINASCTATPGFQYQASSSWYNESWWIEMPAERAAAADSGGCGGGCIGGIIGGCFVPTLLFMLWIGGVFAPKCPSPFAKKPPKADVQMTSIETAAVPPPA